MCMTCAQAKTQMCQPFYEEEKKKKKHNGNRWKPEVVIYKFEIIECKESSSQVFEKSKLVFFLFLSTTMQQGVVAITLLIILSVATLTNALQLPSHMYLDATVTHRVDNAMIMFAQIVAQNQSQNGWKIHGQVFQQGKKYLLLDSVLYSEQPTCAAETLPFSWDFALLEKALPVQHTLDKLINTACQSLDKWLIYVKGSAVVICTDPQRNNMPEHIIMEQAHVKLQQSEQQQLEEVDLEAATNCQHVTVIDKSVSDSNFALQEPWFINVDRACRLSWIVDEKACQGANKPIKEPTAVCIFLHGVGQTEADKGDPVNEVC